MITETDSLKSVIRYADMKITPDLLEYLGFTDVTSHVKGLGERGLFRHSLSALIIQFNHVCPCDRHERSIKRRFRVSAYKHLSAEGLSLGNLITHMLRVAGRA